MILQEFPKLDKEYRKMDAPGKKKFASQILKAVKGNRKLGQKVSAENKEVHTQSIEGIN